MRCITTISGTTTNVIGNCQDIVVVVTSDVVRMAARARHLASRHATALPGRLWKSLKRLPKSWPSESYSRLMSSPSFTGFLGQPVCGVPCSSGGTA